MKKWLSFIVLAGVTAGVVYLTVNTLRDQQAASVAAIPEAGAPLVPGLTERLNDTAVIEGTSEGKTYEIRREGDGWVVPSKAGYAANSADVRRLLLGVAGLKRLEPKTANPDLYERIGLGDPTSANSESTRLKAIDSAGETLFDVVFGTRKFAKGDSTLSEIYVRLGDDPQSWLVAGKVPEATEVDEWVASELIGIDRERVARALVEHADGDEVTVKRASPDAEHFTYVELPEGAELEQQWRVNDIGHALAELEFDDVAKADDPVENAQPLLEAHMETFDGLRVRLSAEAVGETVLATLRAEVYEPEEASEDMDSAGSKEPAGEESAGEASAAETPDVGAEAERLNALWSGWRYTLPKYKADYLMRRAADLIKQPEAEEETSEGPSAESLGLPGVFDLKPPGQSE